MARPLSLVISKEPDTPSLDCRSGQGLSSISCAISIPIEAHSHAHCHAERVSPSLARLAKSDWCRHCGSGRMRKLHRSEEHTSELQSLMRISYAVFCLKQKNTMHYMITHNTSIFKTTFMHRMHNRLQHSTLTKALTYR